MDDKYIDAEETAQDGKQEEATEKVGEELVVQDVPFEEQLAEAVEQQRSVLSEHSEAS